MPTQAEIAKHLGISQQAVSQQMEPLGIDWRNETMDTIRLAYLTHLRGVAAGHRSADGIDLARERAMTERVDRELKELTLAEKKGQLVNLAQLEPMLRREYQAFKAELEALSDKLKDDIDALYGVDADREVIASHVRSTLIHLARHDDGGGTTADAPAPSASAERGDDHHGLGDGTPQAEPEGDGQAGHLQP